MSTDGAPRVYTFEIGHEEKVSLRQKETWVEQRDFILLDDYKDEVEKLSHRISRLESHKKDYEKNFSEVYDKLIASEILLSDHKEVVRALEDEQVLHIELLGKEYDKTIKRQALAIEKLKEQRLRIMGDWQNGVNPFEDGPLLHELDAEITAILQEAK